MAEFLESWTGSNGAAWDGTRWPTFTGNNAVSMDPDIQSNAGRMRTNGTGTRGSVAVASGTQTDVDATFSYQLGSAASNGQYVMFCVRASGTGGTLSSFINTTWFEISLADNLARVVRAGATGVDTFTIASTAGSYRDTTKRWVRVQAAGTTYRMKVWADGDSEPVGWTVSGNDGTHTDGSFGFQYFTTGGGENAVTFDELAVNEVAGPPAPSGLIPGIGAHDPILQPNGSIVSNSGGWWTDLVGGSSMLVTDGWAHCSDVSASDSALRFELQLPVDHAAEIDGKLDDSGSGFADVWPIVRCEPDAFTCVCMTRQTDGQYRLWDVIAGSVAHEGALLAEESGAPTSGITRLRLVADGDNFYGYDDGELVISGTNDFDRQGRYAGFGTYWTVGGGGTDRFDSQAKNFAAYGEGTGWIPSRYPSPASSGAARFQVTGFGTPP